MATEKVYSRVSEAEDMVKKLCEKQPDALWCVKPENVAIYGIENKQRSEKNKTLAKIKPVKGEEKAILQDNGIPIRYLITLYWSDWREWKENQKQWVIFHELLHIHHEIGKTIKHDCEDFRLILAHPQAGVDWFNKDLPDIINGDVKFDLNLRPSMEEAEETDNIKDEEERAEAKKERKEKKEKKEKDGKENEVKEVKELNEVKEDEAKEVKEVNEKEEGNNLF